MLKGNRFVLGTKFSAFQLLTFLLIAHLKTNNEYFNHF